jgi:hypothetical protein
MACLMMSERPSIDKQQVFDSASNPGELVGLITKSRAEEELLPV